MATEEANLSTEIALLDTCRTKLELFAEYLRQQHPITVNRQLDLLNQVQSIQTLVISTLTQK